ncbi:MAG: cell division ATP-binding protein FtsE [Clostridiales bacterium]|nr:MAG: cell division ATP-binding protein FtsE [Clostridiales bacterium]
MRLRSVSRTYDNGTVALKRVSLKIEDGEFVFITGHSGAGKSSIIRLLMCEDVPTFGDVIVDGVNTRALSHSDIPKYRRRLGVVFQDFRLIPSLNVYDNVAFAMRAVGKRRRIIKKRVAAVLNIVELTGKEKCMPNQLSGGEQQRVALARAIVNNPKIILADEPTGNIDPDLSLEIMKMLNIINQSGITVIVVTHEQNLVNYFQKRVITLSGGRIKSDTAREIISDLPDEGDVDDDVIDETIIDETVPAPGELETTPEIQEEQLSGSADIIPGITLSPLDDDSSLYDEDEPETDNEINEDETLDGGDAE